jgi:hypothetical protein
MVVEQYRLKYFKKIKVTKEDRMFKHYAILFFLLILCSTVVYCQFGKITGKVTEKETMEPLIGANVVIEGTSFGSATDVNGDYVILNVPAGTYEVKVSYIGFQGAVISNVRVLSGLTRELDINLSSTSVQVKEVMVIAERPLIEKSATNAVRIQGAEDIENLPVRGVQAYYALQPGVVLQNGTVYMRGGRNDEVGFAVEGANVRDVIGNTNRSNINGNLITTIPEAIEEISVESGGFGAEYGSASSGIVNQTFKTGGSNLAVTFQAETDNFGNYPGKKFLGTYSYGYSDYVLTVGVPIVPEKIKFFVALENQFVRDRDPWFWSGGDFGYLYDNGQNGGQAGDSELVKWDEGNLPGRMNNRYTGNTTLAFNYDPIQVRLAGAFTWSQNKNNNRISNLFDLDRVNMGDNSNLLLNAKVNYFFTQNTFAELNVNYLDQRNKSYDPAFGDDLKSYNDSIAAAQHGWEYQTLTSSQSTYNFNGFTFNRAGTPMANLYSKDKNTSMGVSASLTSQMEKHELKVGGSFEYWSISHYDIDPRTINTNVVSNPDIARDPVAYARSLRINSQVNNYGYDEFGNPISDGLDGPKHPYFGSAYIQDKIELSDVIIKAGLRYDIMYMNEWTFSSPSDLGYDEQEFLLTNATTGKARNYFEPRIGFSFPVSDMTQFHLQYGKYVQSIPLYSIYKSRASAVYFFQGGHYFPDPLGYNVEPERTTAYEIGFSQQISDVSMFDITGFYKNVQGQLQLAFYPMAATSAIPSYYAYTNGDFTNVMGLELSVRIRRTNRIQAQLNYTLQDARGTNSFANGAAALLNTTGGSVMPSMVVPLDYAQVHRGSISLDYRWPKGEGGPVLEQLGLNLLFTFNSGHPFTQATGSGGQQGTDLGSILNDNDARTRFPIEPINNSTTPWVSQLDLRLDKSFTVSDVNVNVYIYVQNLLNTKNVTNVYHRTGNAYDDGWLSNASASGTTVNNPSYGQTYTELYQVINLENNQNQFRTNGYVNYGNPRQLRVGARIEL